MWQMFHRRQIKNIIFPIEMIGLQISAVYLVVTVHANSYTLIQLWCFCKPISLLYKLLCTYSDFRDCADNVFICFSVHCSLSSIWNCN